MSLVKPRTGGSNSSGTTRASIAKPTKTLDAYAHFIGEPTEYVLNQVIDTVLAKDKDFQQWRTSHPESYVPRHATRRGGRVPLNAGGRQSSAAGGAG